MKDEGAVDLSTVYEEDVDGVALEEAEDAEVKDNTALWKKQLVAPDYNPVEILLAKLEKWLLQQPEWGIILSAPRKTRRQAITLISKRLLTIPNRYGTFGKKDV